MVIGASLHHCGPNNSSGQWPERAQTRFPTICLHFRPFSPFFARSRNGHGVQPEAVTWKELLRGKMPCRIRPAATRTYSGQWTRDEAAISGHRFTVQCPQRRAGSVGFRRRPGLCPQKPKESLPAPRRLFSREKEKSGPSDAKSFSASNSTRRAQGEVLFGIQ